jgi:hypothetical protein
VVIKTINNNAEGVDELFKKKITIKDLDGMTVSEIEKYVAGVVSRLEPEVSEEDIIAIIQKYLEENPFEIPETYVTDEELDLRAGSIEAAAHRELELKVAELEDKMTAYVKSDGTSGDPSSHALNVLADSKEYQVPVLNPDGVIGYTLLPEVTEDSHGAMSPEDKVKLDEISEGAEKNIITKVEFTGGGDGGKIRFTDVNGNEYNTFDTECLDPDDFAVLTDQVLAQAKASGEFDGKDGVDGVGIASIEQTTTSTADDGDNIITVTLTNGQTATFTIQNGSKGSTGTRGKSIIRVTSAVSSGSFSVGSSTYTYRISKSVVANANGGTAPSTRDIVLYSYYLYPIAYVDGSYCYCGTRTSIRGAGGSDATVTLENIVAALGYDPTSKFLTSIPSEYVTETELTAKGYAKQSEVTQLSEEKADISKLSLGYGTDGKLYIFHNGTDVGNGIEIGVSGDIVGTIDENNNIILSGELADGTYTLKYKNDDDTYTDIGTLEVGELEPPHDNGLFDPAQAKLNYRIRGTGEEGQYNGVFYTQNYIPLTSANSFLCIKGCTIADAAVAPHSNCNITYYDMNKVRLGKVDIGIINTNYIVTEVVDASNKIYKVKIGKDISDVACSYASQIAYARLTLTPLPQGTTRALTTEDVANICIKLDEVITV